jgi:hypothetical protein
MYLFLKVFFKEKRWIGIKRAGFVSRNYNLFVKEKFERFFFVFFVLFCFAFSSRSILCLLG